MKPKHITLGTFTSLIYTAYYTLLMVIFTYGFYLNSDCYKYSKTGLYDRILREEYPQNDRIFHSYSGFNETLEQMNRVENRVNVYRSKCKLYILETNAHIIYPLFISPIIVFFIMIIFFLKIANGKEWNIKKILLIIVNRTLVLFTAFIILLSLIIILYQLWFKPL